MQSLACKSSDCWMLQCPAKGLLKKPRGSLSKPNGLENCVNSKGNCPVKKCVRSTGQGKFRQTGLDKGASLDAAEERQVEIASSGLRAAPAWLPLVLVLTRFPYASLGPLGCFARNRRCNAPSLRLHLTGRPRAAGCRGWLLAVAASWARNDSLHLQTKSHAISLGAGVSGTLLAWAGSISAGLLLGAGQTCARKGPKHWSAWYHPPPLSVQQCRHSPKGHRSIGQMWLAWQPKLVPEVKLLQPWRACCRASCVRASDTGPCAPCSARSELLPPFSAFAASAHNSWKMFSLHVTSLIF